jgi:hypothetical protein
VKRENWVALGLVLIVVALLFLAFSNSPTHADNYVPKGSVDNSNNYANNHPPEVSVSGNFTAGQHFYFNFTKGRYWGLKYDVENQGLEPTITDFAPDTSIPAHKIVGFDLYTPSGDRVNVDVYVIYGTDPFAVVYSNQSADFVSLEGGNLTLAGARDVGMEGTVNRNGTYTVKATAIVPPVYKDENTVYDVNTDPPLIMSLWNIETVETKPYFVPFISIGTILIVSGAVSSIWAGGRKRRQSRHLKKTLAKASRQKRALISSRGPQLSFMSIGPRANVRCFRVRRSIEFCLFLCH